MLTYEQIWLFCRRNALDAAADRNGSGLFQNWTLRHLSLIQQGDAAGRGAHTNEERTGEVEEEEETRRDFRDFPRMHVWAEHWRSACLLKPPMAPAIPRQMVNVLTALTAAGRELERAGESALCSGQSLALRLRGRASALWWPLLRLSICGALSSSPSAPSSSTAAKSAAMASRRFARISKADKTMGLFSWSCDQRDACLMIKHRSPHPSFVSFSPPSYHLSWHSSAGLCVCRVWVVR